MTFLIIFWILFPWDLYPWPNVEHLFQWHDATGQ